MTFRQVTTAGLFSLTVFLSALLLFVVQPMASSMVLPELGGSSTVWTISMLFFQVMLLAGYYYAHRLTSLESVQSQLLVHGALLVLAVLFLPVDVRVNFLSRDIGPGVRLLVSLLLGIGLPTFVVSTSAPLFQHWFGRLNHPHSEDPYYLYAASNAGSMVALLGYPFFIDRYTTLPWQSYGWTMGFALLTFMMVFCVVAVYRTGTVSSAASGTNLNQSPGIDRKGLWVLYTFIPSSLMLGVTQFITTDLASVPLLWVLPLAIYLGSFILVFARLNHPLWLYRLTVPPAVLAVFALSYTSYLSYPVLIGLHLVSFFLVSMYFHGLVARDRPETEYLTEFYIFVALGGSIGGVFNALIAPVVFDSTVEYYLVLALAIVLFGVAGRNREWNWLVSGSFHVLMITSLGYYLNVTTVVPLTGYSLWTIVLAVLGVAILLYWTMKFPELLYVAAGLLFFIGYWGQDEPGRIIAKERTFYGQYRILDMQGPRRVFMHGTTNHGAQKYENGELVNEPVSYYHPDGPMGDIALSFDFDRVGIGGLGAGGLASYVRDGTNLQFFEIDPTVEKLARQYFDYLDNCADQCEVQIGDARQLIEDKPSNSFSLIIMDAYSSDAIPTHLITREAVQLYLSRVRSGGAVIFHVSNRHLDLEGVLGSIVDDIGAVAMTKEYYPPLGHEDASSSTYVAVARKDESLEKLRRFPGWKYTEIGPVLWTDNYTNIVSVLAGKQPIESGDLPMSDPGLGTLNDKLFPLDSEDTTPGIKNPESLLP